MYRTCTKCQAEKLLTEYYRHPHSAGGRTTKCIECTKSDVRANRAERLEYYRQYDRSRTNEPKRKQARYEYALAHSKDRKPQDPVKRAARTKLGNALRDGKIVTANRVLELAGY